MIYQSLSGTVLLHAAANNPDREGVSMSTPAREWGEYPYRVESCSMVTPVIAELWLAPSDGPVPFLAGQYVLLCDNEFRVPQRSYSLASAPRADGRVSILVTRVNGGVTSTWACGLRAGDEVLLEGPFGTFVTSPDRRGPVLLLGAGSGLAPLQALAEAIRGEQGGGESGDGEPGDGEPVTERERQGRHTTLFFSSRDAAHEIDAARHARWDAGSTDFRYLVTHTRDPLSPRHRRIPELLAHEFEDLVGWEVFASGPSGFVTGCAAAAASLGARPEDIHTEEFFVDPQPWGDSLPPLPGGRAPAIEGSTDDH